MSPDFVEPDRPDASASALDTLFVRRFSFVVTLCKYMRRVFGSR